MIYPAITDIAEICNQKGLHKIILSPGSRCAPLTLAFTRHPGIQTWIINDERSAAFIALGMADQLQETVGLVCTSGSAAYNYAPAIAEAFFREIPLVVFTADRPPEWIDQLDGQTIRQQNIYNRHIKKNFDFPVDTHNPDAHWFGNRIISEAINWSMTPPHGPVHINVPIREPLYPENDENISFNKGVKVIKTTTSYPQISGELWNALVQEWNACPAKLIVAGQGNPSSALLEQLTALTGEQKIPVAGDIIANIHPLEQAMQHQDILLAKALKNEDPQFSPDLLITFGLSVISKNLKLYLRKFPPREHWHIVVGGEAADTFKALTRVVHLQPENFFSAIRQHPIEKNPSQQDFFQSWMETNQSALRLLEDFFFIPPWPNDPEEPQGEFRAVKTLMEQLPDEADLHLANSMAVRYANFTGLPKGKNIKVFANRGASGIDGSNSSAVGTHLASGKTTILLTGDMAFFYDRNAFWHNYALPGLRIIILNNHGGGIFRLLAGSGQQPELEEYFETYQNLTAANTAKDFNMDYLCCNLQANKDLPVLKENLTRLFAEQGNHGKILEIFTTPKTNKRIFSQFQQLISNTYAT